LGKELGGGEGFLIGDCQDLVKELCIQNLRHKAGTDALNTVAAGGVPCQYRRGSRLHTYNSDSRFLFLQESTCAGNRAACTYTAGENIHTVSHSLPNFGTGSIIMSLGIGRIPELACKDRTGDLL